MGWHGAGIMKHLASAAGAFVYRRRAARVDTGTDSMELIRGLHNLPAGGATRSGAPRECVATIGNFDGVHRGHQAILEQLKSLSRSAGLPVTVVIFEPQPREYFAGDQAPPRLTRLRDKVELLAAHGADRILCLPFNDALRSLTARQFIERVLIDGLRVRHLGVGTTSASAAIGLAISPCSKRSARARLCRRAYPHLHPRRRARLEHPRAHPAGQRQLLSGGAHAGTPLCLPGAGGA